MKVKELKPMLLDAVVAKCLGYEPLCIHMFGLYIMDPKKRQPIIHDEYSTLWEVGGPVIDHMSSIGTLSIGSAVTFCAVVDGVQRASECQGPILEACMRAFAEVMHGEVVSDDLQIILAEADKFENG
jgi:hypothetical protein